jgi:small subunit ribosomal protein S20
LAHSTSAEKRHRQSLKRRDRNRPVRSAARTSITKARSLIATGAMPDAEAAVRQAVGVLDKAQEKGIIHANNAARRKSRLMARYNLALAAAAIAHAEAQAAPPTAEEPVETGKRRRSSRKGAEKPAAAAAEKLAATKGRARTAKAPARKKAVKEK